MVVPRALVIGSLPLLVVARGQGAAVVEFEIATQPGLPPGAEQAWSRTLGGLDVAGVRIRAARGGEKPEVRTARGATITYHVIGLLNSRNQLVVPGGTFDVRDRTGIAAWIDRLKTAGPRVAGTSGRLPFDLDPALLSEARQDLRKVLRRKTKSVPASDVLSEIQAQLAHPIRILSADEAALRQSDAAGDELEGLTCGTALAALVRPAGLAFAPARAPNGTLEYRVFPPSARDDIWPIGWDAEDRRRELAPKLYEFLNVEVSGVSVQKAVDVIGQRLGLPILWDRNALARLGIDPAAVAAELPAKRTSYSLALQKLLFQSRLKMEVRVDEADHPFLWITSVKPIP
jgi:hypothetical protein